MTPIKTQQQIDRKATRRKASQRLRSQAIERRHRIVERAEALANLLILDWKRNAVCPIDELAQHRFDIALSDEERLVACLAMEMIKAFAVIEAIVGSNGDTITSTIEGRS